MRNDTLAFILCKYQCFQSYRPHLPYKTFQSDPSHILIDYLNGLRWSCVGVTSPTDRKVVSSNSISTYHVI